MLPYYLDQYLSCSDPQGKICSSFNLIIADWPCSEELQWVLCCSVWLQFHHSAIWNVSSHFSATNTMWVTVTTLWCSKVSGAHSTDMKTRWKLLLTYYWTLDPRSGFLSQSLTSGLSLKSCRNFSELWRIRKICQSMSYCHMLCVSFEHWIYNNIILESKQLNLEKEKIQSYFSAFATEKLMGKGNFTFSVE